MQIITPSLVFLCTGHVSLIVPTVLASPFPWPVGGIRLEVWSDSNTSRGTDLRDGSGPGPHWLEVRTLWSLKAATETGTVLKPPVSWHWFGSTGEQWWPGMRKPSPKAERAVCTEPNAQGSRQMVTDWTVCPTPGPNHTLRAGGSCENQRKPTHLAAWYLLFKRQ